MTKREIKELRRLLGKMLCCIPGKFMWQTLRIRTYDLFMHLGSLDNKILFRELNRRRA